MTETRKIDPADLKFKLTVCGIEMPVSVDALEELGMAGSDTLDDLLDLNISYSSSILNLMEALAQEKVQFEIVLEQIMGALYKHKKQWSEMINFVTGHPEGVVIHVCPMTGAPMVFMADDNFTVKVNDLTLNMPATALSSLYRVTHATLDEETYRSSLSNILETGFLTPVIMEDLGNFIQDVFIVMSNESQMMFMEFVNELFDNRKVTINFDPETGEVEVEKEGEDDDDIDEEAIREEVTRMMEESESSGFIAEPEINSEDPLSGFEMDDREVLALAPQIVKATDTLH